MSIESFFRHLKIAARLVPLRTDVDPPRLDRKRIERLLRRPTLWLTPKAVDGYAPAAVDFLPEPERQRLTESVERFRKVAAAVPGDAAPTEAQFAEARAAFQTILEIVRPDKYADAEAFALGKQVEREVAGQLPPWVGDITFETGIDVSGDPALRVLVEADDIKFDRGTIHREYVQVSEALQEAASRVDPQWWTYVGLRGLSEREYIESLGTERPEPEPSGR